MLQRLTSVRNLGLNVKGVRPIAGVSGYVRGVAVVADSL